MEHPNRFNNLPTLCPIRRQHPKIENLAGQSHADNFTRRYIFLAVSVNLRRRSKTDLMPGIFVDVEPTPNQKGDDVSCLPCIRNQPSEHDAGPAS